VPDSVTNIGESAFSGCSDLTTVTIPKNVASIGGLVFELCRNLGDISVDALNTSYSSVDGVLIDKNHATLIKYPSGKAGSYTVPNGVTTIGEFAFSGSDNLTSVTVPNSVAAIGEFAFSACPNLTSISVPNSVIIIGNFAFHFCPSLTSFTIPNSVTNVGDGMFFFCSGMTNVTIPNSVTSIGENAFAGCAKLLGVTIPSSVTTIRNYAFYGCIGITGLYFQGNAPALYSSVFSGDSNATAYCLPGTTGWGDFSANTGIPTALWFLPNPLILQNSSSFGMQTNGFGFTISWATNIPVVVEACATLANPMWSPVRTNTLTDGSSYFSDPHWTNYPVRFYRLRSP
jgi:hypothetical protein